MYRIFIVEDDAAIAGVIRRHLEGWGYTVRCAERFDDVLSEFAAFDPHLVLLDISLPFFNGYHWCQEIRRVSKAPILFLTSASDNVNVVMAMQLGGDDLLAKPFDLQVLSAKVQALLRRAYDFGPSSHLLSCGAAVLNVSDGTLDAHGQRVELTRNECRILQLLLEHKGEIVSRDALMTRLWESDSFVDENTLTVNVNRLRKKLDKAGLHVVFMPSIKQFRDKKVRILNGSHTGMVPIALQMGCETVMDAFNTPDIERFVNDMVAEEVIPMIDEDRDELKKFAAGILERFYNPFIKHMLRSISLNSLSKWEARNYPTVRDNWFKAQRLAEREAFTFAALMTLYGPNSGFEPDDTREFVDYICANWDSADMEATIAKIVKESGIFTVDFSEVPGFIGTVAGYVRDIETLGMKDALKKFLGA